MSDESADTSTDRARDTMPGAGAGDAAHTTQIPRIERTEDTVGQTDKGRPRPSGSTTSGAVKTDEAKTDEAKTAKTQTAKAQPASLKSGSTKSEPVKTETSANEQPKTQPPKAGPSKAGPSKAGPSKAGPSKPGGTKPKSADAGSSGRPLSAKDYARTTSHSASSTAVIPAVKDERQASSTSSTGAPSKSPVGQSAQVAESHGRAATLRLSHVEPWSVTRMAFAISVAMMVVAVVAVAIFWVVLEVTGVWDQVDGSVTSVLSDNSSSFRITDYLGFTRLVGLSLVLSALNVVIATVLATIAAHLYNLAAQLLGGFEVTYTSED